ncbi:MAG TPA: disulfide bond formation protein B [Leucothrix mucor]|nr:disulfide bond formation protein B [Leucothrix mucor]
MEQQEMSIRPAFIIGFIITAIIMTTALFFQYGLGLEPCPLCVLQRIVVMTLGAIFLIGLLHNPNNSLVRRLYGQIVATASLAGLAVAGRHTWLQHLPADQAPECGAGLDYWIKTLPPSEVIEKIFQGTGECAEVVWTFASFSIPEWSLVVFAGFFLYGIKLLIKGH